MAMYTLFQTGHISLRLYPNKTIQIGFVLDISGGWFVLDFPFGVLELSW